MKLFKPKFQTSSQKTIYLHIGVPKTASSTIQKGLFDNQKALSKIGYLYPKAGLMGTNHKNIFFELCSLPEHKPKYSISYGNSESLASEIASTRLQNIIISAEHFALLKSSEINSLKNIVQPLNTKVIVYLRRQDQVIQSGWLQNTKRLVFKKSLQENIEEELSTNRSVYHYDYLLGKWANSFGKENMIVRIFEPEKLSGHIFEDFLKTCGVDNVDEFTIPRASNISPGYKTLGLIQEIAKRIDFDHLDLPTRIELGKQIELFCSQLGWADDDKFNTIDQSTFRKIWDHFQPGNKQVANQYLGIDDLFDGSYQAIPEKNFQIDQIKQSEVLDLLSHILNNLDVSTGSTN